MTSTVRGTILLAVYKISPKTTSQKQRQLMLSHYPEFLHFGASTVQNTLYHHIFAFTTWPSKKGTPRNAYAPRIQTLWFFPSGSRSVPCKGPCHSMTPPPSPVIFLIESPKVLYASTVATILSNTAALRIVSFWRGDTNSSTDRWAEYPSGPGKTCVDIVKELGIQFEVSLGIFWVHRHAD